MDRIVNCWHAASALSFVSSMRVPLAWSCTHFLRVSLSVFALSLLSGFALLVQSVYAAPTVVVVGSKDPLVDVPAVQAAVDRGGTVILRGTFDFGTDSGNFIVVPGRTGAAQDAKGKSTVFVYQKDVTILGERGPKGELLTVVKNGMPAFWVGWDGEVSRTPYPGTLGADYAVDTVPTDALGRVAYRDGVTDPGYTGAQTRYVRAFELVNVTVKWIHFESPKHFGVKTTAARDVTVVGNEFTNVQFGGLIYGAGLGNGATHIAAAAGFVATIYPPYVYPAIIGSVVAERNVVNDVGTELIDTHSGECFGIATIASSGPVIMERNDIRNVGRSADGMGPALLAASGLLVIENYATIPLITHNTVYNSAVFGIWDYCVIAPSPGAEIAHNTIVDSAIGIASYSEIKAGARPGGLIHQNLILQDGQVGVGQDAILAFTVNGATMTANDFQGDYAGPLVVLSNSTNCTLLDNRDLRPTSASGSLTYFLDASTSGNLIQAASGTAFDLGTNNLIFIAR